MAPFFDFSLEKPPGSTEAIVMDSRKTALAVGVGAAAAYSALIMIRSMRRHTPHKYGKPAPGQQPPPIKGQDGELHASHDGHVYLFSRKWEPKGACKATLMILHGTVDHSGQYAEIGRQLAAQGIAVFATDMRGWGLSDGDSMYLDSMDAQVADVKSELERIHTGKYAGVERRFILGKSIGGLIAAEAVIRHPKLFSGLIGLSGAFKVDKEVTPPPSMLAVLQGLDIVAPKLPIRNAFDPSLIVSDPAAFRAWESDPLVSHDKLRVGYIVPTFRALTELEAERGKITCPVLMLWGTGDKVVTREGHEMLAEGGGDKTMITYEGGYHNLLAEPAHKAKVVADISRWVLQRA